MKKEPVSEYIRRRLGEFPRQHNRIARESGVPQTTVSRIFLGQCSPRLSTAQLLLDWLDRHDKSLTKKLPRSPMNKTRKSVNTGINIMRRRTATPISRKSK